MDFGRSVRSAAELGFSRFKIELSSYPYWANLLNSFEMTSQEALLGLQDGLVSAPFAQN